MRKIALFLGICLSLFMLTFLYRESTKGLDSPESRLPTGLIIYYSDGAPMVLSRSFWKNLDEIPPHLINALLASEDKHFYEHFGVDIFGIARAIVRNINRGTIAEGGSTITQQLARTLYLSPERSWSRKIRETFIALWLERIRTKDEILEMYLNSVYLGNGLYGFASASKYYFGKDLSQINLQEAAVLVATVRSPGNYNPFKNPEVSKKVATTVINAMVREGYLDQQESRKVIEELKEMTFAKSVNTSVDEEVFWRVVRELKEIGYGLSELRQGYKIYTTLDRKLMMASFGYDDKTAIEAINPITGAIYVYRGIGLTYPEGQRQIGSAIKPLYYYLALLEGWQPDSKLFDLPIKIGDWTPENFDKQYKGTVTLSQALIESRNIPSVNLFMQLGMENVVKFLQDELKLNGYYPSDLTISLGTLETSPEEILKCYAAIFNGGVVVKPYVVERVEDPLGRVVYRATPKVLGVVRSRKVDTLTASTILLDIMKQVVEKGTGVRAKQKVPVAGKTGTSEKTAWFIGGDLKILLSVSVDGTELTGGVHAAPIWSKIISYYDYTGNFPSWKVTKQQIARVIPTGFIIDSERIIQWIEDGSLSEDALLSLLDQMDNKMVLEVLSVLNQRSPEFARNLWDKLKTKRVW
ncbi:transglycosylase domain-containing protein [Pseudothermotoga thermarum]|uniref:Peptidoglycan glycosyltransferase n=1 Tax=Pseudothermotoga thermarum DSM 5069 TaxID=688269 RepID=F7YV27_9THEM|nr:transglycosylase domain-containing protein [Pseudothermotoga thermarum]AEH50314.1 Peptidoglycan glycosyltransferase [Pseudothermotoga thermarum DSM 5069]